MKFDMSHLTQPDTQAVLGPIQDDEALFLYGLIRGLRCSRVLELGGLAGYSAKNFCEAVGPTGSVYTVDVNPVPQVAGNHKTIIKDARSVTAADLDGAPIDLVFFDCHDKDASAQCFENLRAAGIILDRTVIALHDTNVHYTPVCSAYPLPNDGGWVHQWVERSMVNDFADNGYHVFNLHPPRHVYGDALPFRHGLTICQKYERLPL